MGERKVARIGLAWVLVATILAGCGAEVAPTKAISETRVTGKKAAPKPVPTTLASLSPKAAWGPGSSYAAPKADEPPKRLAAEQAPRPVAEAAASPAPAQVLTKGPAAAKLPDIDHVAIVKEDPAKRRMIPMLGADDLGFGADFAPEGGTALTVVRAPSAGLPVAKVKFEVKAGAITTTTEGAPEEFYLPAELKDELVLEVPFALTAALEAYNQAPGTKRMRVTMTMEAPDGTPIPGANGVPFRVDLDVDVL